MSEHSQSVPLDVSVVSNGVVTIISCDFDWWLLWVSCPRIYRNVCSLHCCIAFRTRLNRGQAIGASLQKIRKCHSIPISTKIWLMKALVWPVAMYGCQSWTLGKNEETRLDVFEMKGLRRILRVLWTAKKTNEWVLNKAGVKRELLDTVKARKLAYYDHIMRKPGSCLEEEIMQGTMPGARRQGRQRTVWVDKISTWTGLSVEESVRMTEDRDKGWKYVHGVQTTLGSRTATEQNRTEWTCL